MVASRGGVPLAEGPTDAAGRYHFDLPKEGTFDVAPAVESPLLAFPASQRIEAESDRERAGVDFDLCAPVAPQGFPLPPCVPAFDDELAERVGLTGDPAGKDDEVFRPSSFPVRLTIREGRCDAQARYAWYVDGAPAEARPVDGTACAFELPFAKEGAYEVRVEQSPPGAAEGALSGVYTRQVVVQDFLIVSLGDSAASGQGNPPFTDHGSCDRSEVAFGVQAARRIEEADDRSAVTLVHLACSGATLEGSLGQGDVRKQLRFLKQLVGDRQIDALHLTIGINDLEFTRFLRVCTIEVRCQTAGAEAPSVFGVFSGVFTARPITYGDILQRLQAGLPARFSGFAKELRRLFPKGQLDGADVYLSGYPNPLHDERGRLCRTLFPNPIGPSKGFIEGDGEREVSWAQDAFLEPLRRMLGAAAGRHGWRFVDVPDALFATRGYCSQRSWFRGIKRSVARLNPDGTFHPTADGHAAMADDLTDVMRQVLLPAGRPRAPR
jgi:lysophospholipase L1-like esterase